MARLLTDLCDLRVKDILPFLSGLLLFLVISGYIGGFIVVNISYNRHKIDELLTASQVGQVRHPESGQLPEVNGGESVHLAYPKTPVSGQLRLPTTPRNSPGKDEVEENARSCGGQCTRRRQRAMPNKPRQWIAWNFKSFQFYAHSAFFDNRSSTVDTNSQNSDGLVRIITLSTTALDKETNKGFPLPNDIYCELCYEDGTSVRADLRKGPAEPKPIGYGWTLDGSRLREYIYTCVCPSNKLPTSVTLKGSTVTGSQQQCLPVEVAERRGVQRPIALCSASVINALPDPYRLIEWLELQRLMGVSTVVMYAVEGLDKNSPAHKVLDFYSSPKTDMFLDLRVTSSLGTSRDPQQHILHVSPAINDCIYRNMYQYRYIMVVDMDELIAPINSPANLPQMMNQLEEMFSSRLPSNFAFYNSFHYLDDKPDLSASPFTTILRYTRKVALTEYGRNVKSIVDPRKCVGMHNQYCWTPAVTTATTHHLSHMEFVNPKFAVKQAYRRCDLDSAECAKLIGNSVVDDALSGLRMQLVNKMRERVKNIFGHDI